MAARLEHVNVTVSDAERTAALLGRLFGWRVRWSGCAMAGGRSVHVGSDDQYLALYTPPNGGGTRWPKGTPLNHVAVLVDDLDETEARVAEAGLTPFNHGDYAPGRRFYFLDGDGIEFEVVSYAAGARSDVSA
ncbi:VOC family protein [Sphingomonas parva]|uniref:VOC family protein n=1 Tax=Sphingomonas parva TaxID=2555898 RepID=A0A4Y8ZUZ8_9SPHN|nr:VOC family protein [Sphingomonas parva]TFI59132.1 VOC family protein [Sphingomonas parva]